MQINKKPAAWGIAGLWAFVEFVAKPIWNLNIERLAEQSQIDDTLAEFSPLTWLQEAASYLPSSFTAGFVAGALIFAYWDNLRAFYLKASGKLPLPDMRVWTGNMVPYFDKKKGEMELYIYLMNVGDVDFVRASVSGSVNLRTAEGILELPAQERIEEFQGSMPRGYRAMLVVTFIPSRKFWSIYPDMFIWSNPRTSLEFKSLKVTLHASDGREKEVALWDSMRLTTGDEEVRAVETVPIFNSDEDREKFQKALGAVARRFGTS